MKQLRFVSTLTLYFNRLAVTGISLLLLSTFIIQYFLNESPCPLCLLQRAGLMISAIGFLLNLRFGILPSHYVISLLGALFSAFVALRQISLHIIPGSDSFGSPVLGLHLYSWSFIVSMSLLLVTALVMGLNSQYQYEKIPRTSSSWMTQILFGSMLLIALGNLIYVIKISL